MRLKNQIFPVSWKLVLGLSGGCASGIGASSLKPSDNSEVRAACTVDDAFEALRTPVSKDLLYRSRGHPCRLAGL
jgi:hypothetical protein